MPCVSTGAAGSLAGRELAEKEARPPGKLMLAHYTQRASEGGLIIYEATAISITGRGWFGAPGMFRKHSHV
jgi:N-ethylmaleimide reductase